jgi:putative peptidoglycan lipid II flippase
MKKGNRREAIQLLLMILLTGFSQIIALYKSSYTATRFGASTQMDAYNFATNIASFLFLFITSGITTVVIPAYIKKESAKVINTFITIIYAVVFFLVVAILAVKVPLISLLSNREDLFQQHVADYLLLVFLIQGLLALQGVTNAYYQVTDRYLIPKYTMLFANAAVALGLYYTNLHNMQFYLLILLAGSVINVGFDLVIALKTGYRYSPSLALKEPGVKKLFVIFFPTLVSSGVYKIQTLVDSLIASNLATGMLTILSFSNQVLLMVNNLLIGNLTVYAYPKIVAKLGTKEEKTYFWNYTILFHAFICLIYAGFYCVGETFLKLIFEGGKFGSSQTHLLFLCILVSIFGQQFNIVRDLVYRYFYANGNTKSTLSNSVIVSVTNIVVSLILARFYGVIGILLGTTIASIFSLVMIIYRFDAIYKVGVSWKFLSKEYAKNEAAMFGVMLLLFLLKKFILFSNPFLVLGSYGALSVVLYLLLLKLMRSNVFKTSL